MEDRKVCCEGVDADICVYTIYGTEKCNVILYWIPKFRLVLFAPFSFICLVVKLYCCSCKLHNITFRNNILGNFEKPILIELLYANVDKIYKTMTVTPTLS